MDVATVKKKGKWKKPVAILAVVGLLVGGGMLFLGRQKDNREVATIYTEEAVGRGDITRLISAGGTLEPADSYNVTTLVNGDILSDTFEEGDEVSKDDILYTLDSSDIASDIERAQMGLDSAKRSYEDLLENQSDMTVTSPISGSLYSMDIKVGDKIGMGQTVGMVRDNGTLEVDLYFLSDEAATFYVGGGGQLTLDGTFEILNATVTHVSPLEEVLPSNQLARLVTFQVTNNGGLSQSQRVSGAVGASTSLDNAYMEFREDRAITADAGGTVTAVYGNKGDWVSAGQALIQLDTGDYARTLANAKDSIRSAELTLEAAQDALDNFQVESPIAGTVIEKHYKAGEIIPNGGAMLCTIYDMSHLETKLSIDELEILNVKEGQTVNVVADSMGDVTYQGKVTKVSQVGVTVNSMTSYPVTIEITDYEGLLSGMNVTADIITGEAANVVSIPVDALSRGDTVMVTAGSPSAKNASETTEEGYCVIPVKTGISDGKTMEILEGLTDQDTIVYIPAERENAFDFRDMMTPPTMGDMSASPMGGGMR